MKLNSITDIFFDWDHTLWDFDRNSRHAFERVFLKHQLNMEIELFLKYYEPVNLRFWKLYRENKITQTDLRRGRLSETFSLLKLNFSVAEIDAFAKTYIDELPGNNFLLEGTHEILDHLIPRYKLHIITNGFKDVQLLKIKKSNLEKYFTTLTTSDEAGVKKPHPDIFYTALEKAKMNPRNCLMIGDSFEADIEGAQHVGMKTMFFNHREEPVSNTEITIKHLKEIKNYL